MSEINKKSLERLADLARLELHANEEEKFLKDLSSILGHFKELQEVNTENTAPMTVPRSVLPTGIPAEGLGSGMELKNVMREDEIFTEDHYTDAGKITKQFPEHEKGYLKIPPVFD